MMLFCKLYGHVAIPIKGWLLYKTAVCTVGKPILSSNSYKGMIVIWAFIRGERKWYVAIPIKGWLLCDKRIWKKKKQPVAIPIKGWLLF